MNKIAALLSCLVCVSHGRRVHTSGDQTPFKPLTQLSRLILEPETATAFNPTYSATLPRSHPVAPTTQNRLGTGPEMGFKAKETVRSLRARMRALNSMSQTTYTMKLVAGAKVRKAQQAVLRARPFNEQLQTLIGGLVTRLKTEDIEIPLLEERETKSVALITIFADRGLCGPFNNRMKIATRNRVLQLKEKNVDINVFPVGKKGVQYMRGPMKERVPDSEELMRTTFDFGDSISADQAKNITDIVLAGFTAGDYDRVELLYTEFISSFDQFPALRTLIPLLPTGFELPEDEIFKLTAGMEEVAVEKESLPVAPPAEFKSEMMFGSDPTQIINTLLPLYLNGQLLRCLQESKASELMSKMIAMDKASTNCKKLEVKTTLFMHKVRKQRINRRLVESIVANELFRKKAIAAGENV